MKVLSRIRFALFLLPITASVGRSTHKTADTTRFNPNLDLVIPYDSSLENRKAFPPLSE